MSNVVATWRSDDADMVRSLQRLQQENEKLRQGIQRGAADARASGEQTNAVMTRGIGIARDMAGALGLAGGVAGVIQTVISQTQEWSKNLDKVAEASQKAVRGFISLATIQAPGAERPAVEAAARLAGRHGVEMSQAFAAVQAAQSVRGNLQGGISTAEEIFRAFNLGVPIEAGMAAERVGATLGMGPGQVTRQAVIAGKESAQDPAALIQAASSLAFFPGDPSTAFAIASQLAGTKEAGELKTFTKAAGIALSDVSTGMKGFKKLGVGAGASQWQRLQALAGAGIDLPSELKQFGIDEMTQIEALATVIPRMGQLTSARTAIATRATPGMLEAERGRVEGAFPEAFLERRIRQQKGEQEEEIAFGAATEQGLMRQTQHIQRAIEFRKRGLTRDIEKDTAAETVSGGELAWAYMLGFVEDLVRPLYGDAKYLRVDAIRDAEKATEKYMRKLEEQTAELRKISARTPAARVSEE